MIYDALELAKYIVTKCYKDRSPVTNLQLQKILYYIQKDFVKRDILSPAFYNPIEAWKFGPVVRSVYYYFCNFGAMPITEKYDVFIPNEKDKAVFDKITNYYRSMYPWALVEKTHQKLGAWDKTFKVKGCSEVIPLEYIQAEA